MFGRDIRYDGGCRGDVAAHDAAENPGEYEKGEGAREKPHGVRNGKPDDAHDNEGFASIAVGQRADNGCADKLEQGVQRAENAPEKDDERKVPGDARHLLETFYRADDGGEQADTSFLGEVVFKHVREQREDDGEADEIEEKRDEHRGEGLAGRGRQGLSALCRVGGHKGLVGWGMESGILRAGGGVGQGRDPIVFRSYYFSGLQSTCERRYLSPF